MLMREIKTKKIDPCGLEQLVKLKLRNADPNFNLPTELRELSWRQSGLRNLAPERLQVLNRLTHLDLSFNFLTQLPDLPLNLQVLKVSHNHLITLNIPQLKFLRALHVQHNRLETVPTSITKCSRLQSIKLNDNRLYQMPNLEKLELHELDLSNNRLSKLPLVWPNIVRLKIDGNFSTIPGPYLGTEFLKKDLKFNEPDSSKPVPKVPIRESSRPKLPSKPVIVPVYTSHVTTRKPKNVSERPNSADSSKSLSSSSSKSSLSSYSINDENILPSKKNINKSDRARKVALENYRKLQNGTENGCEKRYAEKGRPKSQRGPMAPRQLIIPRKIRTIANDSLLKKCLADCIRKNIPENSDLSDGILFVRAYNARRKKHTEALIVELPGPREEKLTPQKSRRNAERFALCGRESGFDIQSRDVLELNSAKLMPFLSHLKLQNL